MRVNKIETPEIVKRHYGLAFVNNEKKIIVYPSAFAIAATILTDERELDERLRAWQSFRKEHYGRPHKNPDSPLFKLEGKHRHLLDVPFTDLKAILLKAIAREEGAQTLYTCGSEEAVQEAGFSTHFLFGKARRMENARGDVTTRDVTIGNPLLDRWNHIAVDRVYCGGCNSTRFEDTKERNVETVCYHVAELWEAFWMGARGRSELVEFKNGVPKNAAIPFPLTPDDLWGKFLEIDTIVARYILGERLFTIDQKLLRLGGLSSPLEQMVRNGEATFQVVRQGFGVEDENISAYVRQSRDLMHRMRIALRESGYSRVGYALEHEGTRYETVGERYSRGNTAVTICFKRGMPVHYVLKNLGDLVDLNGERKVTNNVDPFSRIGETYHEVDDCTRRECESRVLLPGSSRGKKRLWIPYWINRAYKVRRERS